jgi:hypothetical protein
LEEDNGIEPSPIPRWAGFQDQLTPSVPILHKLVPPEGIEPPSPIS